MNRIVRLATGLIVAMVLLMTSGCWLVFGQPKDTAYTRVIAQDGNVRADDARVEREIREASATAYAACLDRGDPGWKCDQYLWPSGYGYGFGGGYGRRGGGLFSVAREAMVEIRLAEGAQEDGAQNAAIRDLGDGLVTERTGRMAADSALSGRIDVVHEEAAAASVSAEAAAARAGAAHGRLDRAARQVRAVDAKVVRRTDDLHARLRALEEDKDTGDDDKDAAKKKEDEK